MEYIEILQHTKVGFANKQFLMDKNDVYINKMIGFHWSHRQIRAM